MKGAVFEKYIEQVRNGLVGTKDERESFLAVLSENLEAYTAEYPLTGMDDLIARFGSPKDVAEEFASTSIDKQRLVKKSILNHRVLLAVVIITILTAIAIIGFQAWDMWKNENFRNGFFVETVGKDEVSVPMESVPDNEITYY